MTRTFEDVQAERKQVPLLVGLAGPTGCGKTFSALRLAKGMQEIVGGEIFGIDTESKRMLHYADQFKFRHVEFLPPFSPSDYETAIQHCANKNAGVIIVDSASHEHEGKGGVLEWHDAELERMAGNDVEKRKRMTFSAWAKPKAARRRLINTVLQLGVNAVFCFRAKEKIKLVKGRKDPIELGWTPIGSEEWFYEMTLNCLLYPRSDGVPTWESEYPGENATMKCPVQFKDLFAQSRPLDESIGKALAEWARGGDKPKPSGQNPTQSSTVTGDEQRQLWNAARERAETVGGTAEDIMGAMLPKFGVQRTRDFQSGDVPVILEEIAAWEPGEDPAQ